jgi:hypothetical protein
VGVFGWSLIADKQTLVGTLTGIEFSSDALVSGDGQGDQDWNFEIRPSPGFESFLQGPGQGGPNSSGIVECEVQPIDALDTAADLEAAFRPLVNKEVTVFGSWVHDISHAFDDGSATEAHPLNGRTEIHPIQMILFRDPPAAPRDVRVWVFAEASNRPPNQVPHHQEAVTVQFDVELGPPPPGGPQIPFFLNTGGPTFVQQPGESASFGITAAAAGVNPVFHGTITVGPPNDFPPRGYYDASFQVGYNWPTLITSCAPRYLLYGVPQTFTVTARDPQTRQPVTGDVYIDGVEVGQTGRPITHTVAEKEPLAPRVARRGGGSVPTPVVQPPQMTVQAPEYEPSPVAVAFMSVLPSLLTTCTPGQLHGGVPQSFEVTAKDPITSVNVAGDVHVDGVRIGVTGDRLTHTFVGKAAPQAHAVSNRAPAGGGAGHVPSGGGTGTQPALTWPQVTVTAADYSESPVAIVFIA